MLQFAFMSNLLVKAAVLQKNTLLKNLSVRFVGFELLRIIQHLDRHFDNQKLLAVEIVAVPYLGLRVYYMTT